MKSFDYPPEIKFKCIRCGICCGDTADKIRHVLVLRNELEKIIQSTNQEMSEFAHKINNCLPYEFELNKTNKKCIFLKENQCTIYEIRPMICRFYPFELSLSTNNLHKFNFTKECPGIGIGKQKSEDYFKRLFRLARERLDSDERTGPTC